MSDPKTDSTNDSNVTPQSSLPSALGVRVRNVLIALSAIALSVALFIGFKAKTTTVSLEQLATTSVPLELALSNDKPTMMEFYADWCTVCQAMTKDMAHLREHYGETVNFVMLNVDNTKWLPELVHYRVDGIPHFVFLDRQGAAIATTIGEQPRPILEANLMALAANQPLPYSFNASGPLSGLESDLESSLGSRIDSQTFSTEGGATDPRSHGSQVVN